MYSHSSSARVGIGKRGHGGGNYRPPPDRNKKDGELVPPPLKACSCLIQLDVPEYFQPATAMVNASAARDTESTNETVGSRSREHLCFPGETPDKRRKYMQKTIKEIRSKFGVHLQIPGRSQQGPVAIVGESYRETIPATAWLLQQLVFNTVDNDEDSTSTVSGRIQRNVKDPNDTVLEGRWETCAHKRPGADESLPMRSFWLFHSPSWKAMACDLSSSTDNQSPAESTEALGLIRTCIDNLQFRIGSEVLQGIDFFFHSLPGKPFETKQNDNKRQSWSVAFTAGPPDKVDLLYRELSQFGR